MAGNNLSPRQKMIGMMYLVLTALLALNVSKEIINAFITINDSLENTVTNLTGKNAQAYAAFQKQMEVDPKKTKPLYEKAQQIKKLSDDMDKYLSSLTEELIRKTDKLEPSAKIETLHEMKGTDNYDIPTNYMCGDKNDGLGHKASEMKKKIIDYKKGILASLDPADRPTYEKRLNILFNTDDPKVPEDGKKTWEMANFYHNPVVATIALITKTKSDVKNAESEIITHLLASINAADFKFDTLTAKVIAPSSYLIEGQQYTADIFLAAMSSTSDPEITVNGSPLKVEGGVGTYTLSASGVGEKTYAGIIKVKGPDGVVKPIPFGPIKYIVAKPSSTVSADKMNVIYIGVPNPMTISVPGVPDEKVKYSVAGSLTLTQDPKLPKGHYIAEAKGQPGEATITVNADFNEKPTKMGEFKFRLKRIPDPVAKIGGKKDGNIPKAQLAAQQGIIPTMEGFDFDLYPRVVSFKMSRYGKGRDPIEKTAESGTLTGDMKTIIDQSRPGDKILFEYINVSMPDGTKRQVNAIPLTVQ